MAAATLAAGGNVAALSCPLDPSTMAANRVDGLAHHASGYREMPGKPECVTQFVERRSDEFVFAERNLLPDHAQVGSAKAHRGSREFKWKRHISSGVERLLGSDGA